MLGLFGYKETILLLYLRIFGVQRLFRYIVWVIMFVVFGYLCGNFWGQFFGCAPLKKFWFKDTPGHCIDFIKFDLGIGSLNMITDLFIFVLPIPMILTLKLSRRDQIGVILVFMGGAVHVFRVFICLCILH